METAILNIRITGDYKNYYLSKLKEFAELFNPKLIKRVEFGKQDIRGAISISLVDLKSCISEQKFFINKWEMLGYIVGFTENKQGSYNKFKRWLK